MERSIMLLFGKTHYFIWAMFNSYVTKHQKVDVFFTQPKQQTCFACTKVSLLETNTYPEKKYLGSTSTNKPKLVYSQSKVLGLSHPRDKINIKKHRKPPRPGFLGLSASRPSKHLMAWLLPVPDAECMEYLYLRLGNLFDKGW